MKLISLDIEVSNKTHDTLREVFTNEELHRLVAKFLLDTSELSDPKQQEKILAEGRKFMNELKNIKL